MLLAEAVDIDVPNRRVVLTDGEVSYDTLLVATGARHHYFGNAQWEQCAPGLKTIEYDFQLRIIHKRSPFDRLRVNGKKLFWRSNLVRAELVEA